MRARICRSESLITAFFESRNLPIYHNANALKASEGKIATRTNEYRYEKNELESFRKTEGGVKTPKNSEVGVQKVVTIPLSIWLKSQEKASKKRLFEIRPKKF